MLKNYFIITLRNIFKQKSYSFINIAGLAVGLASFILIVLWVQDELSFDRFHQNTDEIYRIVNYEKYSNDEEMYFSQTPAGLAPALDTTFPEIKESARVRRMNDIIVCYKNNRFNEKNLVFADPSFFTIFSFPLIRDSAENLLTDPFSILITEETALKYFGSNDPIGKDHQHIYHSNYIHLNTWSHGNGVIYRRIANKRDRHPQSVGCNHLRNFNAAVQRVHPIDLDRQRDRLSHKLVCHE